MTHSQTHVGLEKIKFVKADYYDVRIGNALPKYWCLVKANITL